MRTFKEIVIRDDEWQNLKNFAYYTLGVITLVMGAFASAFTVSLLNTNPTSISDIEPNNPYEVTLAD